MDNNRHQGKTVIVTGAGSGIGQASVLRFAAEGATVTGCDISTEGLEITREALVSQGLTAELMVANVTKQVDVENLVSSMNGRIDILANVAGIMDHFVPLGEVSDELWNRVLDVNLNGVMRLTRAALPVMENSGSGSIVTVSSEAALGAGASGVAYAVSKNAVMGLVKHVAYFYGPQGIRSNAVLPGPVSTGIGASASPESGWAMERAGLKFATMPPTPAAAAQIASVISWLASDEATNVNGAQVTSDGGWSAA